VTSLAGDAGAGEFDELVAKLAAQERTPSEPRHLTGGGNGQRLVDLHGLDIRYVHPWKQWLVWDGRRFQPDTTGELMRRAKMGVLRLYAEAAAERDPDRRKALATWARRSDSEARMREMINLAASEPYVPVRPAELDSQPWRLNVEDGTIDLRTGELLPHSRRDLITKLAPVRFDPKATCPTWLAFLDRVLGHDADLVGFLQRAIGYSLTGDTGEQVLFFLYGTGANGKSTLLETLRALLGDYAQQTDFTTLLERRGDGPRNDIAALQGARFVAAIEAAEGRRLAEGLVKQLTGGDAVSVRKLYSEPFTFRPEFKLWLAANHKPVIRGTDQAIWRRIRLVPFTIAIPEGERDHELGLKLRAELPGILRWAVAGCQKLFGQALTEREYHRVKSGTVAWLGLRLQDHTDNLDRSPTTLSYSATGSKFPESGPGRSEGPPPGDHEELCEREAIQLEATAK
jgi:putative DNA primase/helicase